MKVDDLQQLVEVIEQAVIGVVGEEFFTSLQTEDGCFIIKIVIPKDG